MKFSENLNKNIGLYPLESTLDLPLFVDNNLQKI